MRRHLRGLRPRQCSGDQDGRGWLCAAAMMFVVSGCNVRDPIPPVIPEVPSGWIDIRDGQAFAADWSLSGPNGSLISGSDDTMLRVPTGEYQLDWAHEPGWLDPLASGERGVLAENDTIIFVAVFEKIRPLTTHEGNEKYPACSPANTIAFTSDRAGNDDIWLMDLVGSSEPVQLTHSLYRDFDPTWAPGNWSTPAVAFTSNRAGAFNIWYEPLNGDPAVKVTDCYMDCYYSEPTWSAYFGYIAYCRDHPQTDTEIWTVVPGTPEEQVTVNAYEDAAPNCGAGQLPFMAFVSNRNGNDEIYLQETWTLDMTGRSWMPIDQPTDPPRNLTNDSWNNRAPCLSPDGTRLAFVTDYGGNNEVCVIGVTGGTLVVLAANGSDDNWPCWTADGTAVVFSSNRAGSYDLWLVAAD